MHACTHAHTHTRTHTDDSAADYVIEDKVSILIWSFGQVSPEYNHRRLTDAEFTLAHNERFFPVDTLKYHGGNNRGVTTINFFNEDEEIGNNIIMS